MRHPLRNLVFWPTFLTLLAAVVTSYVDLQGFLAFTQRLNSLLLDDFSWLFSLAALAMVLLTASVYFSPLGQVRIGGTEAKPLLNRWRWFVVTLCCTLAVGVLFWTTAEPLYHLHSPPTSLGIEPGSPAATRFAMSTMFMHWTLTPYAIYVVPSLVFALAFHNRKRAFSIGAMLEPVLGERLARRCSGLIDTLAMFALVAGMASSLGTGALTLAGGLGQYIGGETTPARLGVVIALIVVTYVASAISGLQKGIVWCSVVNTWLMLALGAFVLLCGPTLYMFTLGTEGLGDYLQNFFSRSLFTGASSGDKWPQSWTIFYWAVWFAWAPVSALFLGKIGRGYTVREFIRYTALYPALFTALWICVFSGFALHADLASGGALNTLLAQRGIEHLLYELLGELPGNGWLIALLLFVAFISFVTAADANTDVLANLSVHGVTADAAGGSPLLKMLWGAIVGIVGWIMVAFVGVDGIKMLSNLGGFPALFIVIGAACALPYWMSDPRRLEPPVEVTEGAPAHPFGQVLTEPA